MTAHGELGPDVSATRSALRVLIAHSNGRRTSDRSEGLVPVARAIDWLKTPAPVRYFSAEFTSVESTIIALG